MWGSFPPRNFHNIELSKEPTSILGCLAVIDRAGAENPTNIQLIALWRFCSDREPFNLEFALNRCLFDFCDVLTVLQFLAVRVLKLISHHIESTREILRNGIAVHGYNRVQELFGKGCHFNIQDFVVRLIICNGSSIS